MHLTELEIVGRGYESAHPLIRSLGDLVQIAFVPRDLDAAVAYWTRTMGVGHFFKLEHAQRALSSTTYRGLPCEADYTILIAYWGDLQIELIEQHNDAPLIHNDWLMSGVDVDEVARFRIGLAPDRTGRYVRSKVAGLLE